MGAIDRKEDGTRVITPSRLEDLQHRYRLNPAEAEELFNRREAGDDEETAAQAIKDARVVFRVHHEATYSPDADPTLLPQRKREAEEQARQQEARDKHAPAGPYGPEAPYTEGKQGSVTRASDLPH
jgi:hypothetical protein